MKLEKFALVAEIIGAVAIVISLVFVAIEVQRNTRAQNAATMQEVYRDLRATIEAIPDDIRYQAAFDGSALEGQDKIEYNQWMTISLRAYESWYELHDLGAIRDEVFEAYMSQVPNFFREPIAREYWRDYGIGNYITDFTDYVNDYLESNPLEE